MRIWKFYKKPETAPNDTPESVTIRDRYPMYALTDDEEMAKEFIKHRNMDMFIVRTNKGIEKDEYAQIANRNRSCILKYEKLLTRNTNDKIDCSGHNISVLMTELEAQNISDISENIFTDEYFWNTAPNPKYFKSKYKKALNVLDYISVFKLMTDYDDMDFDDYSAPVYSVDEVELFISQYKDTFK